MNHKVLLADDSLTIQKVIKITLANQPYDITDASSEEELFSQLEKAKPKLVFLDFNLSEKFTGYELTSKIKSISPSTKVLLLLGTFDSVDEGSMARCGASDKIVKPFDSNKFIAICKQLIDTFVESSADSTPEPVKPAPVEEESPEDQWTVSHTSEHKLKKTDADDTKPSHPDLQNALHKEMSDWGMSVPGVINESSDQDQMIDLPPVIGEVKSLNEHRAQKAEQKYDQKFPQEDDLDYPTIEQELEAPKPAPKEEKPASKLIPIESFNDNKPLEMEIQGAYVPDESDIKSLEAQILDEVEDNLWHADEFEDLKKEVSSKIEEVKNNFQPSKNAFDESLFKPLDEEEEINWNEPSDLFKEPTKEATYTTQPHSPQPQVDLSTLKTEMEEMVKKYVKEYMDEMFQKNSEKVAWEVIPDLAENLIRQELSKISNKILEE